MKTGSFARHRPRAKKGVRIAKWKYDAVRTAIRKVLPGGDRGIEFRQLASLVAAQLSPQDRKRLGSVSWYTVTVKLDLEVRGEIERVPGSKPQRIRKSRS